MRKTVGQEVLDRWDKGIEDNLTEYQRAIMPNSRYIEELHTCISNHNKKYPPEVKKYFVSCLTKREQLYRGHVIRNYFIATIACPAPAWNWSVFEYHRDGDALFHLWTVPSKDTIGIALADWSNFKRDCPELAAFIADYNSGKLDKIRDEINAQEHIKQWENVSKIYAHEKTSVNEQFATA